MSKAQGQFTIIDYNDALTLTGYIGSSLAKTQMYNPDNNTYTPDWSDTNLVLTPSLYVIGTTTDQITSSQVTSVKWYIGSSTTAITTSGAYALSGTKSHILTIKDNVMAGLPGIDYRCVITYKDDSTGLSITHPLTISFSRVVNGSGITDLLVSTPLGNVFKNSEVATLTAVAELWRGSTVDTTNVTYKWAIMDSTVTATTSSGYDADFGTGWRKLSDTTGMYTGTTTATITIYAAAVDSYAVFRCVATDSDSTSATYNTDYTDVATFIDNSDPIQVVVTSTGGDVFKNGEGSTVLTAVVYQAGAEIDTEGNGTYTWTKYDKDGAIDTTWGTSGSKTGKTLSVSNTDVDTKATFMVVVSL
nr:MAG TPA: Putative minor structural protein 1 [Caudoviricetes sp.]